MYTHKHLVFICPSRDGPYYVIGYGGRPHRFPHNNFSSVYRIFNKLGHMIPLWKGKNPIYFGVIRWKDLIFLLTWLVVWLSYHYTVW